MATRPKSALAGRKRAMSAAPPASPDGCVITYYFNDRAFQRLFVESNIQEMKDVVRKKLGLSLNTELSLAQLVDDQRIDLEDDADFSAFKFGTSIKPEMYVEVSISTLPATQLASPSITSPSINFDQPPAGPVASSSRQPPIEELQQPAVPTKIKRAKKATVPPTSSNNTGATVESPHPTAAQVEPVPQQPPSAPVDSAPKPKPKKRARKSDRGSELDTTVTAAPSVADISAVIDDSAEQPPKKRRKSKTERASSHAPVAVTLPAPGPSRRKSVTAATSEKPVAVTPAAAGSNADIIQRWASGSSTNVSKAVAPTAPQADTPAEVMEKPKKKKKKAAEPPSEDPVKPSPPKPTACLVCLSPHPGFEVPLKCPLLSGRDGSIITLVEHRVKELAATQGPSRIHQMLIARLRDWLKARNKEAEALNAFVPPVSSTPTPSVKLNGVKANKSLPDVLDAGSSRPIVPKKSKLSSVVVSRHSEGSSTDDEDILKTVIQHTSESEIESVEDDDARGGNEVKEAYIEPKAPAPVIEPVREQSPPSEVSKLATLATSGVPPPPSQDPKDIFRSSQRLSQPNLLALLDDLEEEEAGKAGDDDSDGDEDDGGSELARSTPSDVVRRRHRKSVRIEADDSDVAEDEDEGKMIEDIEMQDAAEETVARDDHGEEDKPMRLSQILESSQSVAWNDSSNPGVQAESQGKGKEKEEETEKQDDDIEEYESEPEVVKDKVVLNANASSPIEQGPSSSNRRPNDEDKEPSQSQFTESGRITRQSKKVDTDIVPKQDNDEEGRDVSLLPPPPKKRGRPSLSQAAKDERAAERTRIQAEKVEPKKRGRPSLSKPDQEDDVPEKEVKATRRRMSTSISGTPNDNGTTMSVEPPTSETRQLASSQAKSDVSHDADATAGTPTPKKRGRPPLSQAVIAEREAEKERVRAEKAIKRLEARTAKASERRGKGEVVQGKVEKSAGSTEPDEGLDTTTNVTLSGAPTKNPTKAEVGDEESHPEWAILDVPASSSRTNSSQADGTEWMDPMRSQGKTRVIGSQKATSITKSMLPKSTPVEDPDTEEQPTKKTRSRPLFMPSSGLRKADTSFPVLPSSSPVPTATPSQQVLSQATPSGGLSRPRLMASLTLPRFSTIKKDHDSLRQQRRATQILNNQPLNFDTSKDPKPNGESEEILNVDESSSDESSSDDAANKTTTPSQKKRRSVLGYFSQG